MHLCAYNIALISNHVMLCRVDVFLKATAANIAQHSCHQEGGDLVSIPNAFFNSALLQLQGFDSMTHVGLQRQATPAWAWTDGTNLAFIKWASGQPSNSGACGALSGNDSSWYSVNCEHEMPYFCEHAEIPDCPSNWTEYNSNCYEYRNSPPPSLQPGYTSDEAEYDCEKDGAHLASIHSRGENDFVASLLKTETDCDTQWIGLRSTANIYSWTDGTPLDYLHNCVSIPVTRYLMYGTYGCDNLYNGLPGSWLVTSNDDSPLHVCKSSAPCSSGWSNYNGACYAAKMTKPGGNVTFEAAEQDCRQDNGHLISIHDDSENHMVPGLIGPSSWFCFTIGLGLECREGELSWTDGTPVNYTATPVTCNTDGRYEMYGGRFCGSENSDNGAWFGTYDTKKNLGYIYAGFYCDLDGTGSGKWQRTSNYKTLTGHVCKKPLS